MKTLVCTLFLALCAMTAMAADVSGKWSGTFSPSDGNSNSAFAVLKQTGSTVTGTAGPAEDQQWPFTGTIEGNRVTGEVKSPDGPTFKLDLTLDGDKLKGNASGEHDGQPMKATMELTRVKT
jgi:hypothetical protein